MQLKMKNLLLMILASASIFATHKPMVHIDSIYSKPFVVDEWKNPGLYSPVNIFDGDVTTSYAATTCDTFFETSHGIDLTILFKKNILIDEIRIMNGLGRNDDLFKKNNRIKNIKIALYTESALRGEADPQVEEKGLADVKEFQIIKFTHEYNIRQIRLDSLDVYNGSKYNDTCITELEFYYKGQKIYINDVGKLKKTYIADLNKNLIKAFSDKEYEIYPDGSDDSMILYKDGNIKYKQADSFSLPPVDEIMPDRWKVESSKLYMRISNVWILYKYAFRTNTHDTMDIILYTNPYEYVPKDHPHRLYYKRLPDDYQFQLLNPRDIKK